MQYIELAGSPKAGKDSICKALEDYFNSLNINYTKAKGGIAGFPSKQKDSIEALIWSMCNFQIKYMTSKLENTSHMIINRGFFDRLIWIEQYVNLGILNSTMAKKYADCWLEFALDKKDTIVFLFTTPPQESIERDARIKEGSSKQTIMNAAFLEKFNKSSFNAYEKYKNYFKSVHIIDENLRSWSLKEKIDEIIYILS